MKIAFISYEYPPDTAYGGIATYVHQAAKMLRKRGHYVEVFAGSPHRSGTETEDGILVHRIVERNQWEFPKYIGRTFAKRHTIVQFDVLEGPEYFADAQEAIRLVPDIPLVVKLHTPFFLIKELSGDNEPSFLTKFRVYIGALRRGIKPYWQHDSNYIERMHTLDADEIATPSRALGNELVKSWGLDAEKISHVPYPYIPSDKLLSIPVETHTSVVTFMGRLETRKGVLDLGQAIPLVLQKYPNTHFRFVGSPKPSPQPGLNMRQYLEKMLLPYGRLVEFTGPIAPDCIPSMLAATDICVFPSLWENFPNVCLESMAAARGVVGSSAGGMAEMLDFGEVGRVTPPRSPERIAAAVIELLEDPALRMRLGQAARDRVLTEYNQERIGALQETSYDRAIARRRAAGKRPLSTSIKELSA